MPASCRTPPPDASGSSAVWMGHKDQSYALWGLTQESLRRTIFPLGGLTKAQVREEARRFGLNVAAKGESFEICFVTDNNYERFLKDQVPGLEERVQGG